MATKLNNTSFQKFLAYFADLFALKANIKWSNAFKANKVLFMKALLQSVAHNRTFCWISFTNSDTIATQRSDFIKKISSESFAVQPKWRICMLGSWLKAFYIKLRLFNRRNNLKRLNAINVRKLKTLHDRRYEKSNTIVAMQLQVPLQNTPLLWQLNSHKHIDSVPELLRRRTFYCGDF